MTWQSYLVRQRIQGIKDVLQRQQRRAGGRGHVVEEQVDAAGPQHPPHLPRHRMHVRRVGPVTRSLRVYLGFRV